MRRALLLLPALLIAVSALPGHAAAPKPQVVDPAGDVVGTPGMDVVSVTYSTTGSGVGKKYVPKKFVVTLKTAGPVETTPGVNFVVSADTTTCGKVDFLYFPGTPYSMVATVDAWAFWGTCDAKSADGNSELLHATVKGNTVSWSFGMKAMPLKVGTVFSNFRVYVDPCDPILCFPTTTQLGLDQGLFDAATGAGSWKLG